MKKMVMIGLMVLSFSAVAEVIEGRSTVSEFVMRESCGAISSQFLDSAKKLAESDIEMNAEKYCSGEALRASNYEYHISCGTSGPWMSMTRLYVRIQADYKCLTVK